MMMVVGMKTFVCLWMFSGVCVGSSSGSGSGSAGAVDDAMDSAMDYASGSNDSENSDLQNLSSSVTLFFPNIYLLGWKAGSGATYLWQVLVSSEPTSWQWHTLPGQVAAWLWTVPSRYQHWWWNLVTNDPIHVMVETTLIFSICFILFQQKRRKDDDWKKQHLHKLSPEEEAELLAEWKHLTRAPLTPTIVEDYVEDDIVVHHYTTSSSNDKTSKQTMMVTRHEAGETSSSNTTATSSSSSSSTSSTSSSTFQVLNMATLDFLGMANHSDYVRDQAQQALDRYGCGSCGPRGFYGTVDLHVKLEEQMASFWKTERAILYSDGASTIASTIAAFCKRGDLLVVDSAVAEPLVTGVTLSRAHVKWFQHNDMEDLRRVMEQVAAKDVQLKRPKNAQRRFVIVEGLYKNTGTICPLDQIVALKEEFAYRLILDESHAVGVLGKTGRGVTEFYNLQPMQHVDITTIGLETALGSIGGVTVGTEEVVEHQRLSGSGYCFSASAPPYTAAAAMAALQLLETNPHDYLQQLQDNIVYMYEKLKTWCRERSDGATPPTTATAASSGTTTTSTTITTTTTTTSGSNERTTATTATTRSNSGDSLSDHKEISGTASNGTAAGAGSLLPPPPPPILIVTSDERSPIVVIKVNPNAPGMDYLDEGVFFAEVARECLERGVAVCVGGRGQQQKSAINSSMFATSASTTTTFTTTTTTTTTSTNSTGAAPKGPSSSSNLTSSSSSSALTPPSYVPLQTMMTLSPSLRMTLTAVHTHADIDKALTVLGESVDLVMKHFREESK